MGIQLWPLPNYWQQGLSNFLIHWELCLISHSCSSSILSSPMSQKFLLFPEVNSTFVFSQSWSCQKAVLWNKLVWYKHKHRHRTSNFTSGNFIPYHDNGSQKQPPEVFYKKAILKNFAMFTGKHLCESLLNKVAGLKDTMKACFCYRHALL